MHVQCLEVSTAMRQPVLKDHIVLTEDPIFCVQVHL